MDIKLAVSRSGHDKDSLYVIVKEEANLVYLADGKLKPIEKPKKKEQETYSNYQKSSERDYRSLYAAGFSE